jgi:mannosyltransferase OCH1-like enzyme
MTYKDDTSLPELFKKCKSKAKQFYTDFDFKFYSDLDMNNVMTTHFPDFKVSVFDKLPVKIMKIDIFRYCLMELYGGLYLDMDQELCRRFVFKDADVFLCLSRSSKLPKTTASLQYGQLMDDATIGNSVIASKPGHIFWKYVRDEITTDLPKLLELYNKKEDRIITQVKDRRNYIIEATGPKFLTKVYNKYASQLKNVKLVSKNVFHDQIKTTSGAPPNITTTDDKKILKTFLDENDQHSGFHHCSGTWLKSRI